jgi:Holliday junction resolvasome RuvABC DNA-binding subunit
LGKLFVESTPAGLRFFHSDGTPYGSSLCPAKAEVRARAEGALRIMGFSARDVKLALARIPKGLDASLEEVIRRGLAELGGG